MDGALKAGEMTSSASLPQMQNTHSHLHLIAQVAPAPGTAHWRPQ